MATEVTMPKLGLTMVDGTIIEWKKKEGEVVEKGEILFVIETEKVTFEVEAPVSGILGKIIVPEGETRPIGEVLAYILQPGETLTEVSIRTKEEKKAIAPLEQTSMNLVSITAQPGEEVVTTEMSREKVKISPVARAIAEEHGVDFSKVIGSGPEGRIVKKDILKVIDEAKSKTVEAKTVAEETSIAKAKLLPLSGMRRTIARRMSESHQIPHSWIVQEANVTKLREARDQMIPYIEAETGQRLTYTDLIIKALARAVRDYPIINSRWTDNGIEVLEEINIGLAINVDKGLIVPAIRRADKRSLAEITRVRADFAARGKEGKLGIDEMAGSTITFTNMGMAGLEIGLPLLNPPEAAIIAVGTIKERPFVVKGQVVAALSLNLTLGFDHRVLDGFVGAQFLNRMRELIEQPLLLL